MAEFLPSIQWVKRCNKKCFVLQGTLKDVTEHELNDLQGHLDLTLVYTAKQELNTVECRRRLQV